VDIKGSNIRMGLSDAEEPAPWSIMYETFHFYGAKPQTLPLVRFRPMMEKAAERWKIQLNRHPMLLIKGLEEFRDIHIIAPARDIAPPENAYHCGHGDLAPPSRVEMALDDWIVRGIRLEQRAALMLLASGRKSGLVIQLDDEETQIIPVYEGSVLSDSVYRITKFTNRVVDRQILCDDYTQFTITDDLAKAAGERVRKHDNCRVAFHFHEEWKRHDDERVSVCMTLQHSRNEHKSHVIAKGLIAGPEVYFKPVAQLAGLGKPQGPAPPRPDKCLPDYVANVLQGEGEEEHDKIVKPRRPVEPHLRPLMCRNILLCGPGAKLKGLKERLHMELADRLNPALDIVIEEEPGLEDDSSAFLGAIQLANSEGFRWSCFTKAQFKADQEGQGELLDDRTGEYYKQSRLL